MQLADTHTHLYLPDFESDRKAVIFRAVDLGVNTFLLPNIDRSSIRSMLELRDLYPNYCYPMMGLHPNAVRPGFRPELKEVRKQLYKSKYYAVGEIGIDLYRGLKYQKEQVHVFRTQVELALELNLPVVIHSRDSFDLIVKILKEYNDP
ncbi:MAG: TatD family hydrolase, partial [Bacteroidales bacterium]